MDQQNVSSFFMEHWVHSFEPILIPHISGFPLNLKPQQATKLEDTLFKQNIGFIYNALVKLSTYGMIGMSHLIASCL